jgi:hypothetical protein
MDIHKPKAAHSVREFLIEIGTIICGILIALGLEQGIETIHRQELRREAREAIRGEISRNMDAFRRRDDVQSCIDTRLGELETLLASTPLHAKLPQPLWVGRPQVWNTRQDLWLASASGARTSLLPPDEQASYSEIYSLTLGFAEEEKIEQLAWAHLRALETLPTLDEQTRAHLIEQLHEARYANFRIRIDAIQTRDRAGVIGIKATRSPWAIGSKSVCLPLATARDKALTLIKAGGRAYPEP